MPVTVRSYAGWPLQPVKIDVLTSAAPMALQALRM